MLSINWIIDSMVPIRTARSLEDRIDQLEGLDPASEEFEERLRGAVLLFFRMKRVTEGDRARLVELVGECGTQSARALLPLLGGSR